MVDFEILRWQHKTIRADSDFAGVFFLALIAAWFFFLWLLLASAASFATWPALLRFAIAKGFFMPDWGMAMLGFATFHFNRELKLEWKWGVAGKMALKLVPIAAAYLVVSLIAFELASFGATGGWALPWVSPLYGPVFRLMIIVTLGAIVAPLLIFWLWTTILDVVYSFLILGFVFYGVCFYFGVSKTAWLWSIHVPVAWLFGGAICSMLFRGVQYLTAIRGPAILLGWVAIAAGSILARPALFYTGFLMVLGGLALDERVTRNPIEDLLLPWARTAPGIFLAAPIVLLLGPRVMESWGLSLWPAVLVLALLTQLLAIVFYLIAEPGLRRLRPQAAEKA